MEAIPVTLTSSFQVTVPQKVRDALHLAGGDEIVYEILEDGTVILRRAYPLDVSYLQSLNGILSEWITGEDEQAYRDL